ncbi:MAG: DUF503 domain-containing protein [Planctomycetes bacterium]|nr:DUF503 domain-containing protein [Planctomycetota bacterium]
MHVGTLRVRLNIRESRSLKDKRQVVKSIVDRLRNEFNVAVAEVDARDHHKMVVLGMATVGEDAQGVKTTLDRIADALRKHPVAEFCECESLVEHCQM